jgi:hypothetical protein
VSDVVMGVDRRASSSSNSRRGHTLHTLFPLMFMVMICHAAAAAACGFCTLKLIIVAKSRISLKLFMMLVLS